MATETKEIKMYNGEVDLVFYPNSHQYRVDKKRLPSVTGIIGQLKQAWAMPWVAKMAKLAIEKCIEENNYNPEDLIKCAHAFRVKQDEGLDIGSQTHEWIEEWIAAKVDNVDTPNLPQDDKAANGVIAFLQWVNEHEVEFLASEQLIYSRDKIYCGTFDAIAVVDGKKTLIDFKTSNSFHAYEFSMQLAAYKQAYMEEYGQEDLDMMGLHLSKETGDFESFDLTEFYDVAVRIYNILVELYHEQKNLKALVKSLSK